MNVKINVSIKKKRKRKKNILLNATYDYVATNIYECL